MKKTRKIVTFEPSPEVKEMLERAQHAGLKVTEIMNEAMRDYGHKVIKGLAKRKAESMQSLSFNLPGSQHFRLAVLN